MTKYNGWRNQATWDMNLKLHNDELAHRQLMYLVKKFPAPFALRLAIIEHFGFEPGVDYQEIAQKEIDKR